MDIGAVILAGGKSRRMGTDKAALRFEGRSFLERVTAELKGFDEIILSTNDEYRYEKAGLTVVKDIYRDCGPLGGLHAALSACKSDALFCMTCDLPLFKRSFAEYMCSAADESLDALVPISKDGLLYPLCAVYKKTAAVEFEKQLIKKRNKVLDAYRLMKVSYIHLPEAYEEMLSFNVNTPQEYARLKTL